MSTTIDITTAEGVSTVIVPDQEPITIQVNPVLGTVPFFSLDMKSTPGNVNYRLSLNDDGTIQITAL